MALAGRSACRRLAERTAAFRILGVHTNDIAVGILTMGLAIVERDLETEKFNLNAKNSFDFGNKFVTFLIKFLIEKYFVSDLFAECFAEGSGTDRLASLVTDGVGALPAASMLARRGADGGHTIFGRLGLDGWGTVLLRLGSSLFGGDGLFNGMLRGGFGLGFGLVDGLSTSCSNDVTFSDGNFFASNRLGGFLTLCRGDLLMSRGMRLSRSLRSVATKFVHEQEIMVLHAMFMMMTRVLMVAFVFASLGFDKR